MKRLNIDDLKNEYIGKTFGWLTVIDVIRNNNRYQFKCKCNCGKEVIKPYNKVISGHTSSCGCFKFTEDYSNKLKSVWETKSDVIKERSEQYKQWCKDNPDKIKARSEKRKKTIEENPNILLKQVEKRKETLKNNPEIQNTINEKNKLIWKDKNKRKEFSECKRDYYANNPNKKKEISDKLIQYYKDNPDIKIKLKENAINWCKNNKDRLIEFGKEHSNILKNNRLEILNNSDSNDYKILLSIIHPTQLELLLNGEIKADSDIKTKCPICGEYEEHRFNNIWRLKSQKFKNDTPPLCLQCRLNLTASSYEQEIYDYISTFYNGKCIRNDRYILNGKELDLYYPEKNIAIEFNGNYWHNEFHKDSKSHYDKFKQCSSKNILLVSIFEYYWNDNKDLIKKYLVDLFNEVENNLSYKDNYMNNNYPSLLHYKEQLNYIEDYYMYKNDKVYTCGYSILNNNKSENGLQFLIDVAEDKGLEYITNEKGDLEIVGKNICFHLADMLSGELDAFDRWTEYHDKGIRCVFVYPPDFSNPNKMNVYRNILLYHCGFARKIYARNTVFRKYKSIVMKRFFEENNIAGYRGSSEAYVLEDKETGESYMCYLIGHSFFGKGKYDCEIARGACKLGVQVIGGASKLWKHIIQENPDIKSIVYYCDRRQYDQRSIGHLMDSAAMKDLGQVYMLKGGKSFVNYWINDVYLNGELWHKSGEYTNRDHARHNYVMDAIHNGDCISVYNPGSSVNIFIRSGYHLENLKVVKDN